MGIKNVEIRVSAAKEVIFGLYNQAHVYKKKETTMSKMKSPVTLKLSEWNRESSFYIEVMVIAIATRCEYKVEKIEKTEQFGSWNKKFFLWEFDFICHKCFRVKL